MSSLFWVFPGSLVVKTVLPVLGASFPSLGGQVVQGNQKKKKKIILFPGAMVGSSSVHPMRVEAVERPAEDEGSSQKHVLFVMRACWTQPIFV